MFRMSLGTAMIALTVSTLCADGRLSLPRGPAPDWALAIMDGDEHIVIRRVIINVMPPALLRPRESERKQSVCANISDDEETEEHFTVVKRRYSCKNVKAFSTGGKKIDVNNLAKFLNEETIVLISSNGNKVDPFYLQLVKPDALILVLPPPKARQKRT